MALKIGWKDDVHIELSIYQIVWIGIQDPTEVLEDPADGFIMVGSSRLLAYVAFDDVTFLVKDLLSRKGGQ